MQRFWSETARSIHPYTAGEQPKTPVRIKLNTNENAYPASPKVRPAVEAAIDKLRLYSPPDSLLLRESLARFYGVPVDWTYAGNGSDEVLALAFRAYFDARDSIAWPEITYSFYPVYAQFYGYAAHPLAMLPGLTFDIGALLAHDGPIVLANPNAPTGIALSLEMISKIAASAEAKGHPMLVDEAYIAFSRDFPKDSAARILADHPNLVVVGTLSKSHALAGMRIGYALGQTSLLEALWRMKDSFNSYPLDHLAIAAGAAALDDREYFERTRRAIMDTRERFADALKDLGFETLPSSANFVFAQKQGISGSELLAELRRHGILVRNFSTPEIKDYLRITIGTDDQMDALLGALTEVLPALAKV